MPKPITYQRLAEIEQRAAWACRCDDEQCVADLRQILDQDVPALTAEIRRQRAQILADPDGMLAAMRRGLRELAITAGMWTAVAVAGGSIMTQLVLALPAPWGYVVGFPICFVAGPCIYEAAEWLRRRLAAADA